MCFRENDKSEIREHWEQNAVFTDAWNTDCFDNMEQEQGAEFRELSEDELLPGELSAATFRVGCYIVRRALRVYNIHDVFYNPESETPADEADVALVRKDVDRNGNTVVCLPSWRERLRVTHEISARHCDSPSSSFTYICRAAEARTNRWREIIGPVYTVKASASIPDEYASLLVCLGFMGEFRTYHTWYRHDPTGKNTKFIVS